MECIKCITRELKDGLAQIPYVEHKKRIFKAYEKISRLKVALILSNAIWAAIAALLIMR